MGIGGAGMAPLAQLVLRSGGQVTGCDAHPDGPARAPDGAHTWHGHEAAHVEGCSALVVTAAVPADHPEIAAAHRAGIPVLKRAEALGALVRNGTVVGVAGTHGKTTTTALTTSVLAAAGLNPTGLVGGRVPAWHGNLRPGGDSLFVVEADEYDRSFLTLRPAIAVVTTLEADHLDIYGSLAAVQDAFREFVSGVPADGAVVGCADDGGAGRFLATLPARPEVVTYGFSAGSMLRADELRADGRDQHFVVRERGRRLTRVTLHMPGLHNVRNALAAAAVARRLGASPAAIREGLAAYSGVERRFEQVGEAAGVLLVDDYAHHPTEVAATLAAARSAYPDRRLVAVFQPHLFSRTRDFAAGFGRALAAADRVVLTDVYAARERPIDGVDGSLIVAAAEAAGASVVYVPRRDAVPEAVAGLLCAGDLCVTLGAGDLNAAARDILRLLAAAAPRSVE